MPSTAQIKSASAQDFLSIDSIRDGVILLKGGVELRAVLMISSINFALKSTDEQDALISQYENFLNSLDFPLQFVVQSRRLDIRPYMDTLVERQKDEEDDLLKIQIGEYAESIKSLVELSNIVSKTFYAVVPFTPTIAARQKSFLPGIAKLFSGAGSGQPSAGGDAFTLWGTQLQQRVDTVNAGLRRLDLRVARLNTEELIELFYNLYNPAGTQRAAPQGAGAAETQ